MPGERTDAVPADSRWMLVCKPLRAPFNDGSTVLVRDLVRALPSQRALTYLGDPAEPLRPEAGDEVVGMAAMGHAPSLMAKVGVMRHLADFGRRDQPLHFFFTPNRLTSSVLVGMRRLAPRRRMVQSLMSSHGVGRWASLLRPLDRVVVLSEYTRYRLVEAGMPAERVVRIYPGVAVTEPISAPSRHRRLLYAGDLDANVVRRLLAIGDALAAGTLGEMRLTVACRPKADRDTDYRAQLQQGLGSLIADGRACVLGQVDDMDALIRSCSLQLFVADHVRRKVDLPLVLLEGLARGLPLLAMDFPPVAEIFDAARRADLTPGASVSDGRHDEPLVAALETWCSDAERIDAAGRDAHTLAQREFTLDRMASAYDELYTSLA